MQQRDFLYSQFDLESDSNTQILFFFSTHRTPHSALRFHPQLVAINLHLPTKCFELWGFLFEGHSTYLAARFICGRIYSNRRPIEYLPDPVVHSVILISFWLLALRAGDDLFGPTFGLLILVTRDEQKCQRAFYWCLNHFKGKYFKATSSCY